MRGGGVNLRDFGVTIHVFMGFGKYIGEVEGISSFDLVLGAKKR